MRVLPPRLFLLALLALTLLGLAACAGPGEPPSTPGSPAAGSEFLKLEIGYPALRIALPVFVAQEQGMFRRHGLEVSLKRFETAQPMIDALAAGQLQVAGYAALPISYAAQARSQVPFLYLTEMLEDEGHPFSFLLVGKDSQVARLADLAGKRVGILPTLAYRVWLEELLEKEGVKGVRIENVAPPLQGQALATGQVAALFTNDPVATTLLRKGGAKLLGDGAPIPSLMGSPFLFGSFNVRRDYAERNPEVVRRLQAALDEAVTFVMQNPREAKKAMAPYVAPEQREFVEFYADGLYRATAETKEEDFQAMSRRYAEQGILKAPLDLAGLVVTGPPAK